jgi:hypothetical protein
LETHSTFGLTTAVGVASDPAANTSSRRIIPSCVAARPTPGASRMIEIIRSASRSSSTSNCRTSAARERSAASPNARTSASAAARRRRCSSVSSGWSPVPGRTAGVCVEASATSSV